MSSNVNKNGERQAIDLRKVNQINRKPVKGNLKTLPKIDIDLAKLNRDPNLLQTSQKKSA